MRIATVDEPQTIDLAKTTACPRWSRLVADHHPKLKAIPHELQTTTPSSSRTSSQRVDTTLDLTTW